MQAELGDLSDRAVQAVVLSPTSASPVQVAAADALLRREPLGRPELFTTVDPTSAAVAAAHWLHAAATVTADASGYDLTQVVAAADDIEDVPFATPTMVLEMMNSGASPHEAVTALISEAMDIAEGKIPKKDFGAPPRRVATGQAHRRNEAGGKEEDETEAHELERRRSALHSASG